MRQVTASGECLSPFPYQHLKVLRLFQSEANNVVVIPADLKSKNIHKAILLKTFPLHLK